MLCHGLAAFQIRLRAVLFVISIGNFLSTNTNIGEFDVAIGSNVWIYERAVSEWSVISMKNDTGRELVQVK